MLGANFVRVENLVRRYGRFEALKGISFELDRGEIVGLLGPNGAGKSTTMKVMSGVLAPSSGEVFIDGRSLSRQPRKCKPLIGYLPDTPPLFTEFTVDEYLHYCARLRGVPHREVPGAVARARQRCGLEAQGKRLIGRLSKGFQQRVGVAQAIVHSPALVILDEPTVGLDPIQIREVRDLIAELGGDHCVLLSSHILAEVQALCDRVQIIKDGEILLNQSMGELERGDATTTLKVVLRHAPPTSELQRLTGVTAVEALAAGAFRLTHMQTADTAGELVERSVASGWGLVELSPERISLEEVFVRLMSAEPTERTPP